MKKTLAALLITIVPCGSALADSMLPEVREYLAITDAGTAAQRRFMECRNAVMTSPVGEKFVAAKIYAFKNDPDRMKILSNNAKLNKAQKKSLVDFLIKNQECQKEFIAIFGSNSLSELEQHYFMKQDFVYLDMLNGKTSISDGNRLLQELSLEHARDSSAENDRLADNAHAAVKAERQNRQALIQSIDQSLGRIRSIDTKPSQSLTNCDKSFDSINCSTFKY